MANGLTPLSAFAIPLTANEPARAAPTANATGLASFLSDISISCLWSWSVSSLRLTPGLKISGRLVFFEREPVAGLDAPSDGIAQPFPDPVDFPKLGRPITDDGDAAFSYRDDDAVDVFAGQ